MARNIAEVRIIGTNQGTDYVNVLHFANDQNLVDNTMIAGVLVQLATAILQCFVDHLLPISHPSFVLERATARMLNAGDVDEVEVTAGAGPGAAGSVDSTPTFIAVQVEKRAGFGGRRGRGRMYLPSPTESRISGSSLDAGGIADYESMLACIRNKFIGPAKTTDWELGILSRKDILPVVGTIDSGFRGCKQLLLKPLLADIGRRKQGSGS